MGSTARASRIMRFEIFLLHSCLMVGAVFSATIVKRSVKSVNDQVRENPTDLFKLKNVKDAIEKNLNDGKAALGMIAQTIENNIEDIIGLSEYITDENSNQIKNALARAKDVQKQVAVIRLEMSDLAEQTIKKCKAVITKVTQIGKGEKTLEEKGRSLLRSMNSLLRTSERKLKETKVEIEKLSSKMSDITAGLAVFQAAIKAAIKGEENLESATAWDTAEETITTTINQVTKVYEIAEDDEESTTTKIMKSVQGIVPSILKITSSIRNAVSRSGVVSNLENVLAEVMKAKLIVDKQDKDIEKDRELILEWKNVTGSIRDEWGRTDEEFMEEMEDAIVDDWEEIVENFEKLMSAAQNFINHVKNVTEKK